METSKNVTLASVAKSLASSAKNDGEFSRLKELFVNFYKVHAGAGSEADMEDEWRVAEMFQRAQLRLASGYYVTRGDKDVNAWGFRIVKAKKIGELLRLTVLFEDGKTAPMTLDIKDLYAQMRFREQFTVATGRILKRIKVKEFEDVINSVDIEDVQDSGISLQDLLTDVLLSVKEKCIKIEKAEEIDETLRARGFCLFEDKLRFKMSKLRGEYDLKGVKPERLAQGLDDIGAKKINRGIYEWSIS